MQFSFIAPQVGSRWHQIQVEVLKKLPYDRNRATGKTEVRIDRQGFHEDGGQRTIVVVWPWSGWMTIVWVDSSVAAVSRLRIPQI